MASLISLWVVPDASARCDRSLIMVCGVSSMIIVILRRRDELGEPASVFGCCIASLFAIL